MKGKSLKDGANYENADGSLRFVQNRAPNSDLIERLKNLLIEAENGELLGMAYVCQWQGDQVSNGWCLSRLNARRLVGEIEFMKRDMMADVS